MCVRLTPPHPFKREIFFHGAKFGIILCMKVLSNILFGLFKSIRIAFLNVFGRIKVYRWPMFIVYDPHGYDVKAAEIRKAMNMARRGDVFVRRYRNYLDGYFIPGRFSHSGIYIECGIMIHAMSGGIQKIDILDFLRCDGFAILRPVAREGMDINELTEKAAGIAKSYLGNKYDYDFEVDDQEEKHSEPVYCHELVRKCYPDLDIPLETASLWNGIIKINSKKYLAQSFFDSDDFDVVYDSDFSNPK